MCTIVLKAAYQETSESGEICILKDEQHKTNELREMMGVDHTWTHSDVIYVSEPLGMIKIIFQF